jgi:hypothetical protein
MGKTLEMARAAWAEAGESWVAPGWFDDRLKAFSAFEAMVRAEEREACAKVCGEVLEQYRGTGMGKHAELVGDDCAEAIRAMGDAK